MREQDYYERGYDDEPRRSKKAKKRKRKQSGSRGERVVVTLLSLLFLTVAVVATVKYVVRAPEPVTDNEDQQTQQDGTAEDSGERGIRPHDIGPGPLRCGQQLAIEVGWRVFNVYPHISKIHIKQQMTPRPKSHNPGDGRAPRACPTGAMAAGQPTHWHTATCRSGPKCRAKRPVWHCQTAHMRLQNGPYGHAERPGPHGGMPTAKVQKKPAP